MVFAAVKKDGTKKTPPETKRNRKHSEERKGTKLNRRAKNYGAIRQAV